ncbi:MAG: polysaccharide deacetylase family protein [Verrucomicrobia bacterium]|nr:polysaccharide deacetylase family protein [Verrucomicrobiota bacterium]
MTFAHGAPEAAKRVALVFDDGPRPADAEPLLTLLAREKVTVTFSLVGLRVAESPATAKAIFVAGHEIANHSQTHAHPRDLDDQALQSEVANAQQKIAATVGAAPKWYWPPFLEVDARVRSTVARASLKIYEPKLLIVSKDYDLSVNADAIFRNATTGVQDGAVILFHEWSKETLAQLPAILAELRRQNCTFHTFSELDAALHPQTPSLGESRSM